VKSLTCTKNTRLVSFLYELMRDHVPTSAVEGIVQRDEATNPGMGMDKCVMTNGHLAGYAVELADRLLKD
jgi:hypothetical protein